VAVWDTLGRPDPTPWLLEAGEPAAAWVALTELLDVPEDDSRAIAARDDVLAEPDTRALLDALPDWAVDNGVTGHDKPLLATNLLDLLGDMGVRAEDDPRIGRLLDQMLEHADADGRFEMCACERGSDVSRWGALLCDTHAIADVLGRFGRVDDPRVLRALATAEADLVETAQGLAWPCRPASGSSWRGPGRALDICPQTTLEGLRAFSRLSAARRPSVLPRVIHTSLGVWRGRGEHKPYMFGHGRQFKTAKWPVTWYGAYEVADVLGGYPEVLSGTGAGDGDVTALAEIAACLLAYNVAADGRVTPQSAFKGFEAHSFGQKKAPSPFATARVWAVLKRVEYLAPRIAAVDVLSLGSSKGGNGTPQPPKVGPR